MFPGFSGFQFFVENGEELAFIGGGQVVIEGQLGHEFVQPVGQARSVCCLPITLSDHVIQLTEEFIGARRRVGLLRRRR